MFKEAKKHGYGVWKKSVTDPNTNYYQGEYFDDLKQGRGEFYWSSGGHYVGGYFNDFKHGFGIVTWADGSYFKGTWSRGIQNGIGIMSFFNGFRRAGFFKDNVLYKLLTDESMIEEFERNNNEKLPYEFKKELVQCINELVSQ